MKAPTERVLKPKTARARRALAKRAPKAVEEVKNALLLHGTSTSQVLKARSASRV